MGSGKEYITWSQKHGNRIHNMLVFKHTDTHVNVRCYIIKFNDVVTKVYVEPNSLSTKSVCVFSLGAG